MSKCIQCDDLIIVEGEGCSKCNNRFCGACCELLNQLGYEANYLATDCIKCGREFNSLKHKGQVCIVCLENKYNSAVCGDHLVPVDNCGCRI